MLLQRRIRLSTALVYPVLETLVTEDVSRRTSLLPSGCFHDLLGSDDAELAGMGLAVIGNVCKVLREAEQAHRAVTPALQVRMAAQDAARPCPWPGMPTDNPQLPLDPETLPFEAAMFLDHANQFKRRVDRVELMRRIQAVWVPWLASELLAHV